MQTDSATANSWLQLTLDTEHNIHTKGAAELLVKCRLGMLREMISEFELVVTCTLVSADKNKADHLIRVK